MKSPYLEKIEPERTFYSNGNVKSERYMVHMSFIVYKYSETTGEIVGLTINGVEYPPDSELIFDKNEKVLIVR